VAHQCLIPIKRAETHPDWDANCPCKRDRTC
jgi:hypothetical protein